MLNPTTTLEIFQNHQQKHSYKASEVIFAEGEQSNFMYGIIEGEVEVTSNDQTIEKLGPGEVFGISALLEEQPRLYTAIAKKDCILAEVDKRHFLFITQELPMFALEIMQSYAARLDRLAGLEKKSY